TPPPKGSLLPGAIGLGVGAVSLGVGAVTGGLSLAKVSDLKHSCGKLGCQATAQGDIDTARTLGNVSTATFVVGGAAVAAGVVLWVLRPFGRPKPAAAGGASRPLPGVSFRAGGGPGWIGVQMKF